MLLLLLLAGGGYLYFRFVFIPVSQDIIRLKDEQSQKAAIVEKVRDKDNIIRDLKQQISYFDRKKNELVQSVYLPIRVPDILSELEEACAKNKVLIDNISFTGDSSAVKGQPIAQNIDNQLQPKSIQDISDAVLSQMGTNSNSSSNSGNNRNADSSGSGQLPGTLTVSFTFTASYENLMNLIKYYEDNSRLFLLEKLELKGDPSDKCSGRISFKTYTITSDGQDFMYNVDMGLQRQSPFK